MESRVHMDHERHSSLKVLAFALLLPACGASEEQLRARAAFDLKCTDAQLSVVEIDDRTRGVIGCGGRATYVESCSRYGQSGGKTGCTWVMNGSSGQ
jgi:hypothetical protein